jgi:hypothetical protein
MTPKTNNDQKIKQLLEMVETQKKNLGSKPKISFKTNAILKLSNESYNLNTLNDIQSIIEIMSKILIIQDYYNKASSILNVNTEPLMVSNFSINDWIHDFKQRIDLIKYNKKSAQLDKTQQQLNSLISEEAKTELELNNIESFLQNN